MECFKCGVSENNIRLFDVISDEGIVKICNSCFIEGDFPVIKKPIEVQVSESRNDKPKHSPFHIADKSELLKKQEITLRDVVEKNFEKKLPEKTEKKEDLIDNFHWIIMRARRAKHISQKQLAEELKEPETAIKMAERGILPKDYFTLVSKLENSLGIRILKQEKPKIAPPKRMFGLDAQTTKSLTISDLQEMKKKHEGGVIDEDNEVPRPIEEDVMSEDGNTKIEFSKEEIDDLIFKRE